jgi:hypothetical protein
MCRMGYILVKELDAYTLVHLTTALHHTFDASSVLTRDEEVSGLNTQHAMISIISRELGSALG